MGFLLAKNQRKYKMQSEATIFQSETRRWIYRKFEDLSYKKDQLRLPKLCHLHHHSWVTLNPITGFRDAATARILGQGTVRHPFPNLYAVNWFVSRWNGRYTMDVIFFFISRPGGLTWKGVNQLKELFFPNLIIFLKYVFEVDKS